MNIARRKKHKSGKMNRLVSQSLVLSSTRFVSSRAVRFFETGFASPLLTTVKKVDDFARDKVTGPLFKKTELRKNFTMPVRNSFALLFSRNSLLQKLAAFRVAALNVSLRAAGVFFLTFGIYTAAIFLLKRYIALTLGTPNTDDLAFAAVVFVAGLLLSLFGDKSIITSLATSRITGSLLSSCLGINDSSFGRSVKTSSGAAVGISFLLGSMSGVLTLFFRPYLILSVCVAALVLIAVFHIPEFGLLCAVAAFPFIPLNWTLVLTLSASASFLLKCLRLKRNFRFGTADAVMLILFLGFSVSSIASDGGVSQGELCLLSFAAVYFLAKNLICSERLLVQTFNALSLGLRIAMALYILGEYAMFIPHDDLRTAAYWAVQNVLDPQMLLMVTATVLPFSFSLFRASGSKRTETLTVLLAIACALISDSLPFYILILVSLFVYIALTYKAPMGAIAGAVLVFVPAVAVLSKVACSSVITVGASAAFDEALGIGGEAVNFWGAFAGVNGVAALVVFVAALLLVVQRIFGCIAVNRTAKVARMGGTVAASAVMLIVCSFMFNPFQDLRVLVMFWFILGLCGSVYQICSKSQFAVQEV